MSIVQYCTVCFAVVNLNRVRQDACFGTGAVVNLEVLLKYPLARPL